MGAKSACFVPQTSLSCADIRAFSLTFQHLGGADFRRNPQICTGRPIKRSGNEKTRRTQESATFLSFLSLVFLELLGYFKARSFQKVISLSVCVFSLVASTFLVGSVRDRNPWLI